MLLEESADSHCSHSVGNTGIPGVGAARSGIRDAGPEKIRDQGFENHQGSGN